MWKNQAHLCFLVVCIYILCNKISEIGSTGSAAEPRYVLTGKNDTLSCRFTGAENPMWQKDGKNLTDSSAKISFMIVDSIDDVTKLSDGSEGNLPSDNSETTVANLFAAISTLTIHNFSKADAGNYSCTGTERAALASYSVREVILPKISNSSPDRTKTKQERKVELYCVIEMYPLEYFKNSIQWFKEDDTTENNFLKNTTVRALNETHVNVTLTIADVSKTHNGTYSCNVGPSAMIEENSGTDKKSMALLVLDKPQVTIDYVKAVGANKIYLNWTVNDGNDPVKHYMPQFMKKGDSTFTYYAYRIDGKNTSFVLENFEPATDYEIKLTAQNSLGSGPASPAVKVRTLETDPSFTPIVEVKGNTHSTITIGWAPPPGDLLEYIQYYDLTVSVAGENSSKWETYYPQNSRNLPYMFDNLDTATEYSFRVRACSELAKVCGNWSEEVNGTTSDGMSSEPLNLNISCSHYNISRRNAVRVYWDPPKKANGKIVSYQVILDGLSQYRSEHGTLKNETWGPKIKNVQPQFTRTEYDGIPPNTNYTVRVAAVTRTKRPGVIASAVCTMPATAPDNIGRLMWGKLRTEDNQWIFKLFLPRVSERNGPICCYKIYLTRLNHKNGSLPEPESLPVTSYADVHSINNTRGGTYLAEVFSSLNYSSEVFLGDGKNNEYHDSASCAQCLHKTRFAQHDKPSAINKEEEDGGQNSTANIANPARTGNEAVPVEDELKVSSHEKRETATYSYYESSGSQFETVYDGILDPSSNYTGFVEVVVKINNDQGPRYISTFSEYFQEMNAGAPLASDLSGRDLSFILNIVIQILCGLILIVLLVLLTLCLLHKHFSKNIAQEGEAISLGDSLRRALCHGRNVNAHHRHLLGSNCAKPPVVAPISKEDLPKAYFDKHKDSDYGFQHEFELLPDKFADRTTKNSDLKENIHKNRYPDIKSYDQTRVKLSTMNGLCGSDYINANFVIGYKERKKFICAQGPMDNTINDFWRMIWEQHLEIIVMLTNLEEYNKTKCAKYWPENINDSTQYGDLLITFSSDSYYADYIIRNIKVTKRIVNSSGDEMEETRHISQYHYLTWKDFMAPEHPQGITKFIKRINSEYSLQRGPILVHCSAGVGRTGTFVALDTLTQQLNEEGQVSIFNSICDMRYQRNFLVQSLKQYIFLYRALTELAYFGDTEIDQKSLAATVENLKQPSTENPEICKLEAQYQLIKSFQDDTRRTTAIGGSEENKAKNRSETCAPYDKNRVILAPIPGHDNCTYINASFIDGYDDENNFIITQDPMENTIFDFWRMIFEQRIKTIVMFSEIGDGPNKCPRYWADDEMQYENLLVSYIQSESGPYYTKREFTVTNCKSKDTIQVTQFQYNGWPTVEGEVPEVTRGMIEIVNQAQKHSSQQDDIFTIAVHCSLGTDKSSLFVAMCILVMQLKTEKRIDICSIVRKLRAQRSLMIDTYAQYEFLHRAIVNFADLYKISLGIASDC
ncbi:tyrosine-protein phosphatase 69D isoform X2 [Toxorhynchites rutilus septentrionalis]|uniref:tyrosine-protein phosphatase 69D isoform X2 n=1 Tax=Toxorhynchites rutilus septentrionalis TaxID=329112 RepID=UPI0024795C8C|nr:tyrosine-protein phosphatase 69D isoform X2 [Toxorhynchites rutilus septentrionalis]